MKLPSPATLRKKTFAAVLGAGLLLAPAGSALSAEIPANPTLPAEYGRVIYQKEGGRDSHLYIICQSHRNAQTGANGKNTAQVQAEIYRIGEWLITNEEVELLLPEGYFRSTKKPARILEAVYRPEAAEKPEIRILDDQTLEAILSDTTNFNNADKLLKESFHVRLQQVEDEKLYFTILDFLFRPEIRENGFELADLEKLDYLQEKRSATMLQSVPEVVDSEHNQGGIRRKRAILTIGMAHIDEMIRFLKEGKIEIGSNLADQPELLGELKLLQENYSITVILPKSLAEDQEAMKVAKLEDI